MTTSNNKYLMPLRVDSAKTAMKRIHEARLSIAKGLNGLADMQLSQALSWLDIAFDIKPAEEALEQVAEGLKAQDVATATEKPL
jgi:hypothetical protein